MRKRLETPAYRWQKLSLGESPVQHFQPNRGEKGPKAMEKSGIWTQGKKYQENEKNSQ